MFFCCAYRLASHSPCRGTTSGTVCGLDRGGRFKVPRVFALVSSLVRSAIDTTSRAPGIKWFGPVNVLHPASADTTIAAIPHTLLDVVLIVTPTVCDPINVSICVRASCLGTFRSAFSRVCRGTVCGTCRGSRRNGGAARGAVCEACCGVCRR